MHACKGPSSVAATVGHQPQPAQQHQQQQQHVSQYNSNQYDRIRFLGKGSFGSAVVHRRRADCTLVVLKEIELLDFKGDRERCSAVNEARIMSSLSHDNIIKYYNAYTTDSKLIIEMEYASMGTLAAYMSLQVQPLDEQEILIMFRQITSGLSYLHSKNIIHLDLKMANIFVTVEGFLKIGDFGIAQYMDSRRQQLSDSAATCAWQRRRHSARNTSSHLGTLAYSSPERCLGEPTGFKSDIWSLGCILYELITGSPLFGASNLAELLLSITQCGVKPLPDKVSRNLQAIFAWTMARRPEQRPRAAELLELLDGLLSHMQLLKYETQVKRRAYNRFELSTEVALLAAHQQTENMSQINYLHSLVYQVRLDTEHVRVERLHLPQSKRIKEIAKGGAHYLLLTYDNLVYGWGARAAGQLGACGLTSASGGGGCAGSTRSSCVTISGSAARHQLPAGCGRSCSHSGLCEGPPPGAARSGASSLASSTHTVVPVAAFSASASASASNSVACQRPGSSLSKETVAGRLLALGPAARPFVINELNHRRIIQVAAGKDFSVFLSKTGIVMTCGEGRSGCLGRGELASNFTPCMVESLLNRDVVSIGCGRKHVVAVCGNGRAFAWGKSGNGRLGIHSDGSNLLEDTGLAGKAGTGSTVCSKWKYILKPKAVSIPAGVFIKSVFCGDRCTVFIDSDSCCWACGENTFNRLGLDTKKFSKKVAVLRALKPTRIKKLSKYKIVSCSIGKNHASFVTNSGKLIILGQDIDHSYKLRSSLDKEHHNGAGFVKDLLRGSGISESRCSIAGISGSAGWQSMWSLARYSNPGSSRTTLEPGGSRSFLNESQLALQQTGSDYRLRNNRHYKAYLRKSRSGKKMPIECAVRVCCTSQSTLVLTSNNRIYFWGTRKHLKSSTSSATAAPTTRTTNPTEPQLLHESNLDEGLVKLGDTNSSLMSNIQMLGSDQPILQAQDPRLVAKSLKDLWILDYEPVQSHAGSSSSSSSSSSSACSLNVESCCRARSQPNPLASVLEHATECADDTLRWDAILEPQLIISLYVPSTFNASSCSLHIVDLFCFEPDKFYLILDTTVKTPALHSQSRPSSKISQSISVAQANRKRECLKERETPNEPVNLAKIKVCSGGAEKVADTMGDLANNEQLDRIQTCLLNKTKAISRCDSERSSDDNNNSTLEPTVCSVSHGCISMEEPRSLSTFANSLGNHVVLAPSMHSLNLLEQERNLRPLQFKNWMHSCMEHSLSCDHEGGERSLVFEGKSELSNTIIEETSSLPSWVRNDFIQCRLGNRLGSSLKNLNHLSCHLMEDSQAPQSITNDDGATSGILNRYLREKSCAHLSADVVGGSESPTSKHSTAKTSLANSFNTVLHEDEDNERGQPSYGSLARGTDFALSRSQPDISCKNTSAAKERSISHRRASIMDERGDLNSKNLLECDVYREGNTETQMDKTLNSSYRSRCPMRYKPNSRLIAKVQEFHGTKLMHGSHSDLMQAHNYSNMPILDVISGLDGDDLNHSRSTELVQTSSNKTGSTSSLLSLKKMVAKLFC